MIFAIFLILIGFVWLLSNLRILTTPISQIIWPIILIAIGLALISKKKHSHLGHWYCGWHGKEEENKKGEKEK